MENVDNFGRLLNSYYDWSLMQRLKYHAWSVDKVRLKADNPLDGKFVLTRRVKLLRSGWKEYVASLIGLYKNSGAVSCVAIKGAGHFTLP